VVFVERALERRAAMAGGAEGDALCRDGGIGMFGVVRDHESRDVNEHGRGAGFPASGLTFFIRA
jgi:hypothetical protein